MDATAISNSILQSLDEQVKEIKDLQKQRTQLLDRMTVIQELQGNRPIIVRILDQLVRTVPDGIFYQSLSSDEKTITVKGIAESNNRVSSLMRRMDASEWFSEPNLEGVSASPEYGEQANVFDMKVKLTLPNVKEEAKRLRRLPQMADLNVDVGKVVEELFRN